MGRPAGPDVADSLPQYGQLTRQRRGHRSRRLALRSMSIAIAALIGGGLFWVLTQGGAQTRDFSAFEELDRIASWSGFGIDQVTLRGHRFALDSDVFDALELDRARSVVTFDIVAAREAVEDLAWVEHAAITRVYPDQLLVEISERAPFALWQRGDDLLIVDEEGRVLSGAERQTAPEGLLQIAGEGAATEARALTALLSAYPEVLGTLQLAERVAGRRWRLHLQGGSKIELPATGAAAALADLKAWAGFASILADGHAVIDVRASGRIAIRSVIEAAETGGQARSIRGVNKRAG